MAYQSDGTLRDAIDSISRNEYLLPAIQRGFVWSADKICNLFDSVMQGYPIGDFLFWKVQASTAGKHDFYEFIRDYDQRDSQHNNKHGPIHDHSVTAILDGQQRLTAFNIGLQGSLSLKLPYKRKNNPDAYPKKYLAVDVLDRREPDDEGRLYKFDFLESNQLDKVHDGGLWFKVSDILKYRDASSRDGWVGRFKLNADQRAQALDILGRLDTVVHEKDTIWYYEEKDQGLDRVLQIFVRTNSGGAVLTHSDLLLSMATQKWREQSARDAVHSVVRDMNDVGNGFQFSKDHVPILLP